MSRRISENLIRLVIRDALISEAAGGSGVDTGSSGARIAGQTLKSFATKQRSWKEMHGDSTEDAGRWAEKTGSSAAGRAAISEFTSKQFGDRASKWAGPIASLGTATSLSSWASELTRDAAEGSVISWLELPTGMRAVAAGMDAGLAVPFLALAVGIPLLSIAQLESAGGVYNFYKHQKRIGHWREGGIDFNWPRWPGSGLSWIQTDVPDIIDATEISEVGDGWHGSSGGFGSEASAVAAAVHDIMSRGNAPERALVGWLKDYVYGHKNLSAVGSGKNNLKWLTDKGIVDSSVLDFVKSQGDRLYRSLHQGIRDMEAMRQVAQYLGVPGTPERSFHTGVRVPREDLESLEFLRTSS